MDSINPELILNLFKMLSEYPYYFSTSSKLSAVTISFTCVHNGSKSFLTVSRSSPSHSQVSVFTVAVPLSKVSTGVVAGSASFIRMSAIMSAVFCPRFA